MKSSKEKKSIFCCFNDFRKRWSFWFSKQVGGDETSNPHRCPLALLDKHYNVEARNQDVGLNSGLIQISVSS